MPRKYYSANEAIKALGISVDTLRRWDKQGRITTERDGNNRRIVPASEIDRLRGEAASTNLSARNRFTGVVTEIKADGLIAQVEMLVTGPIRVTAVITREAVEELHIRPGMPAVAIVKSTSVMIQR